MDYKDRRARKVHMALVFTENTDRRELYSIIFIRDIVHYRLKCDVLVSLLNFYFPARALRETFHFRLPKLKSNFEFNNPTFHCTSINVYFIFLVFS